MLKWLALDSVPKELPTSLVHLKYFRFNEMCFSEDHGLKFLAALVKCAPNLEKIKLEVILFCLLFILILMPKYAHKNSDNPFCRLKYIILVEMGYPLLYWNNIQMFGWGI